MSQNVWAIESILLLIMGIEPGEFFFQLFIFSPMMLKSLGSVGD